MTDYLSEFPNDILSKITSMLDIKDAAKTSILSKCWRYIWINRLDFTFNECNTVGHKFNRKNLELRNIAFVKVVDQIMQQRLKNIRCFRLQFDLGKKFYPYIEYWTRHAIRDGLDTLDIDMTLYCLERCKFSLPRMISENKVSLKHIRLAYCNIQCQSSLQLDSLVSLELKSVTISNPHMTKILECCPSLEKLILCSCLTLDKLRIDSKNNNLLKFLSLKNLELSEIDLLHSQCQSSNFDSLVSLELDSVTLSNSQVANILECSPSLEKLKIYGCDTLNKLRIIIGNNTFLKFLSLENVEFDFCASNLIYLELQNVYITSFKLAEIIKGCPSLEKLILYHCPLLTNLKICDYNNAQLKMLSLKHCFNLNKIDLCMSNLLTFEYDSRARLLSFNIKAPRLVNALIHERKDVRFSVTKMCLDIPMLGNMVLLMIDLPWIFKFQEDSLPEFSNVRHLFLLHDKDFDDRPSLLIYFIFKCFPSLQTLGLNITENFIDDGFLLSEKIKIQVPEKYPNGTITMLELNGFFESSYHIDLLKYLFENLTALKALAITPSDKILKISHKWTHSEGNIGPRRLLQDEDQWLRAIIPPRFL